MTTPRADAQPHTPLALIVAAWLFVGGPLAWGVFETLKKARALFQ